jgi:magnesium transporter
VVEGLERDIEEVEATVFSGTAAPTERIYLLRRQVSDFFRAVHPMLAPLEGLERATIAHEAPELVPYFRDVRDHLRLVNEEVAAHRDLLTTVLEANMAVISVEQTQIALSQNDAMKQLALIATVFLPLSFIVGFFGQNFAWLTRHTNSLGEFLTFGGGALLMSCFILLAWFRRRRYI